MEPTAPTEPIHLRTADQLERNMVVELIPGQREVVRHTHLVRGAWMVRTHTNLHRCPPDLLIPVVAECVPGIGFVTYIEAVA